MSFGGAEDRLNPVAPAGADETTLGGYTAIHGRAAAFTGSDGEPYTVGVETEETGDPAAPWVAYLVFLRWAQTGSTVMGHMETPDLVSAETEADAARALETLTLHEVRGLLDDAIARRLLDEDTGA
ncbi:MAG: hypothetical protein JWM27_46 [Gemmatimonadetes bacterium]|nr:hypothetical protein [Gemmatimonadota bacterium]